MTPEEFQHIVTQDSALAQPLQRATAAMQPGRMVATEVAAVALVFPVACFVLIHIGLPWLHAAARCSELWRT